MPIIVGEIEELGSDEKGFYVRIRNINKVNFDTRDERWGSEDENEKTFYYEFREKEAGDKTTLRTSSRDRLLYTNNKHIFSVLQSAFDKQYIVEIKYDELYFDRLKLQKDISEVLNKIFTGESKDIENGSEVKSEDIIDNIFEIFTAYYEKTCKELKFDKELGLSEEDKKKLRHKLVENYCERLKTFIDCIKTNKKFKATNKKIPSDFEIIKEVIEGSEELIKEEIKTITTEIIKKIYVPLFKKLNKKLGIDGSIKSVFIRRRKDEI